MERSLENEEREKRRKNIIIKEAEVKKDKRREAAEKIIKIIGVKVEIKEIRRIGEGTEKGKGEMLLIKLENEKQKREIMRKKKTLKGKRKRISEDLTWREWKIRWKVGEIARREKAEGRKV